MGFQSSQKVRRKVDYCEQRVREIRKVWVILKEDLTVGL